MTKNVYKKSVWKNREGAVILLTEYLDGSFSTEDHYPKSTVFKTHYTEQGERGYVPTDAGKDIWGNDNVWDFKEHYLRGNGFRCWSKENKEERK